MHSKSHKETGKHSDMSHWGRNTKTSLSVSVLELGNTDSYFLKQTETGINEDTFTRLVVLALNKPSSAESDIICLFPYHNMLLPNSRLLVLVIYT